LNLLQNFPWLWVLLGGSLGSLGRWWISRQLHLWLGEQFPYGTLFVNALGSAAFGVLVILLEKHSGGRLLLLSGFMGAFTTFSTFSYENVLLMQAGAWRTALLNVSLNLLVSLILCGLGMWATQTLRS
jgi:CrcB protein